MSVLPEHLHVEGEDSLLRHATHAHRYRIEMDVLVGASIVCVALLIAAIAVLAAL